jgi:ankyrin repeat protein
MDMVLRELVSLETILRMLAEDTANPAGLPDSLCIQIRGILNGCEEVTVQITQTLSKYESNKLITKGSWALKGKDDVTKLRSSLEAHKAALNIALDMLAITIAKEIKADTTQLKDDTAAIKEDTEAIRSETEEIVALIRRLEQLQQNKIQPDSRDQFMLQRYLDELSNYAGTVYQESVVDFSERRQAQDMPEDGASDKESLTAISEEQPRKVLTPTDKRSVASSTTTVDDDHSSSSPSETRADIIGDEKLSNFDDLPNSTTTSEGGVMQYGMKKGYSPHPVKQIAYHDVKFAAQSPTRSTAPIVGHLSTERPERALHLPVEQPYRSTSPSPHPIVSRPLPQSTSRSAFFAEEKVHLPSLVHGSLVKEAKKKQDALVDTELKLELDLKLRVITAKTSLSTVLELLARGADPNASLSFVTLQQRKEAVGARAADLVKRSALKNAAKAGNAECLGILLQFGADPNLMPKSLSALHFAIISGSLHCVQLLLEAGARVNHPRSLRKDLTPITPLQLVALGIHEESKAMIELLLKFGAEVNYQGEVNNYNHAHNDFGSKYGTPLLAAISTVSFLPKNVTEYFPENDIDRSLRPIPQSICQIKFTIVETLLRHGADPNIRNSSKKPFEQRTALCSTIFHLPEDSDPDPSFKAKLMDLLLKHGARHTRPVSSEWDDQDMPLFVAIRHKKVFSFDYLLLRGADPKHTLSNVAAFRRTTLEVAAYTHQFHIVSRLIKLGAGRCHDSVVGKAGTPLHCAIGAVAEIDRYLTISSGIDARETISLLLAEDRSLVKRSVAVVYQKKKWTGASRLAEEILTPKELAKRVFLPKDVDRKWIFASVL